MKTPEDCSRIVAEVGIAGRATTYACGGRKKDVVRRREGAIAR